MREVIQKALRTFGSPLRTWRERNPRRNAEETLESQIGPFQSGEKEEAQLTSASKDNAALLPKPISTLPEEVITPKRIPPSRALTRSEATSEDSRQSTQETSDGKDGPQLTEGPSRVVMASDGTKDCMALLLTKRLITEFNHITDQTRKLGITEKELREVTSEAVTAGLEAKELRRELESTEDPNMIKDISENIETQTQIFKANSARRESLMSLVSVYRGNLKYEQDVFQNIFRRALKDANLENLSKVKIESLSPSGAVQDRQDSIAVSETDGSIVTVEELLRRNVYEDVEETRQAVQERQAKFDNRKVSYERALEDFLCDLSNGDTDWTQSIFDCHGVEGTRRITRALIDAEADYASAVARAKALGVHINADDQESNFISDISDGYYESQEASMRGAVDRTSIQYWTESIVASQPEELEEPQEPDDWDAKTIGISDSVSQVDGSRNRKRIDRWREICEQ